MWGKLVRYVSPAHDRIERWSTADGDDVSVARIGAADSGAPLLAILHGLEGSVHSTYAQGLLHRARAMGWNASLLIWRSCDGRIPSVARLYHSGETGDFDGFIRRLATENPERPLYCVGVSLGANVLLKWLGEAAEHVPSNLRAAVAVSTPFDLAAGSRHLESGFSRVYTWHFVRALRRKAHVALARHPSLPINRAALERVKTLWEFDDAVTAPVHGFSGAADYYARSSALQYLSRIRIPTLLFSARDDPFLPPLVLERVEAIAAENAALEAAFSRSGGHVGWIAGPPWAPRYEMEHRVTDWLQMH